MKFDEFLYSHLGDMGKFQKIQFILVCLPSIITSMHSLSWTFAGVSVPFRCEDIPINASCATDCYDSVCNPPGADVCATHYGFDHNSNIRLSATERWEIVCDRSWIKAFIQASYYVGQGIGSMLCGFFGDKYGRKPVFLVALTLQIIFGLLLSVATHWPIYAAARLALGIMHPGATVVAVIIGMELLGASHRKLAAIVVALFFSFGQVFLGTLASNVTDYQWLHVAITTPAILFLSYYVLVSESARWLVSTKKFDEAGVVLKKAARMNGVTLPPEWRELLDTEKEEPDDDDDDDDGKKKKKTKSVFSDIRRNRELLKRTLINLFIWPVVSMVYYGLSMKSDILGGDLYFNFILGGFIEMPALLIVYFTIDRFGRRPLLIAGYGLTGLCLLSNLLITPGAIPVLSLCQLLLSKASIMATYTVLYTYSPELFPTTVRNSLMGLCSTFARIGAITASFVSMWIVEAYGRQFMIIPFGILTVLAALVVALFLPETMGKPLPESVEEIEHHSKTETKYGSTQEIDTRT